MTPEPALLKPGKKPVKRLKARHLSALTRSEIVRLFCAHESYDDVARLMDVSGLTRTTVAEVMTLHLMRKGPGSGPGSSSGVPVRVWRAAA